MPDKDVCEIRLKSVLDARWSPLFEPLRLVPLQDMTLLTGPFQDQSELFGILCKIRDMGLQLLSVQIQPTHAEGVPQRVHSFPVLTTRRLLLREFSVEDVPGVFEILHRPEVNRWLETAPIKTMQESGARVQARINLFKDQMGCRWAICLRENADQVIGSCGYFHVRRGTHTMEAGYELHPGYWKQGIMSEALQAIIRFCFGEKNPFPVHRIEALVAPGNAASIRLLEKLGFEREGLRREFGFWNGCYQDVYLYALLDPR
jgi:[ribosomal protein S5]-alanine N-acetyltransferase